MSMTAYLAYGYDLGGHDGWEIRETNEYGEPVLNWFDFDGADTDFAGAAAATLRARIAGFTEEWAPGVEGYFDRVEAAQALVGVDVLTHCSNEIPFYALVTHTISAHRGQARHLNLELLTARKPGIDADRPLAAATRALGITPIQNAPRWLLLAYGDR